MASELKQKLDYSDYAEFPSDGNRHELMEGDLYVTPAPSPLHQRISKRLQRQLETYFEQRSLGEVFSVPIDVILTFYDVNQPDLVVVTNPQQISQRAIRRAASPGCGNPLSLHTSNRPDGQIPPLRGIGNSSLLGSRSGGAPIGLLPGRRRRLYIGS